MGIAGHRGCGHLLLADETAGVLQGVGVGDPGQEDLGPVVVHHRGRPCAVAGAHLRHVLPDRHQLDPMGRGGGGQAVEFGQGGDVRRFIEHDEQGRIQRCARTGGVGEGLNEDLLRQGGEVAAEATLVMGGRAEVQGVATPEKIAGFERGALRAAPPPAKGARIDSAVV